MEPTTAQNTPTTQPEAPTTVVQTPNKKGGAIKIIAIILIILILIGALVAGYFFIIKPRFLTQKAPDCTKYTFSLDGDGKVTVENSSSQNYPAQQVKINIGSTEIATLDVPEVAANETKTIGIVTVPSGTFSWQATGTTSCSNTGTIEAQALPTPSVSARCGVIAAYDKNWNVLTADDLSKVTAGTIIRFTVLGTTNSGTFDKAKFTINGEERPEVTAKRPDSDEFYDEYTVPKAVSSFTVSAQVHHLELDSWF